MNELDPSEEVIFNAALQLADAVKLRQYLDLACEGQAEKRQRIERLLGAAPEADLFFGRNAVSAKTLLKSGAPLGSVPTSAHLEEHVGTVIGRYKLREKIGEGGCGVVYVAEQMEPVRRRVALKVVKLGMDTRQVIARFEAERQALAMMDHPNIAKVLDAGTTETGRPYFVMELVRGIKITEYCDQNNLTTKERLELFIKVCQAVQHAHQKGVIHRDIKPSNILVTVNEPGSPGVPKVIDFGIAKATAGRLTDLTVYTDLHQFIGTPAYMSPEQATMTSLDIDTRSDIYSLGVLLYELLTGRTPFDFKELMALGIDDLRRTICEKEPLRPSTRLSTMLEGELTTTARHRASEPPKLVHLVRGDLDWIVMRCLEKDRTRRYETAAGLAVDLKRHLNNEPVVARPPSAAYKLQKAWRRNRLAFTAAAAVAIALVIGTVVSSWQAIEANKARNVAQEQRHAAQIERQMAEASKKVAEKAQQAEQQARFRADAEKAEASRLLYAADMNLAQQIGEQNNFASLLELLDETRESPSRGFEWYFWQRQTHMALRTLRGHAGSVNGVAYSPDGQRIVTASEDKTAKVWDTANGRELLRLKGHNSVVSSVAFSPDGRKIVTASRDGTARVWDAANGQALLTFTGHRIWVNTAVFSSDGTRIVSASDDGTTKMWDAVMGGILLTLPGLANCAAISRDGERIVSGLWDGTAKVWDAATGKDLLTLRSAPRTAITCVAFSPDGQRIVTCSRDNTAKLWDAASGAELLIFKGHSGAVWSATFSPDGQRIVTGSVDETAKVWDAVGGQPGENMGGNPLTLKGHSAWVYSVAFSPDGQRIVTGSEDKTAKVWDAASGRELHTLKGHTDGVPSAAFSPDGQRIITGSWDETAMLWDAASGKEQATFKSRSGGVSSVAFSPDGQRIVMGDTYSTARVWDVATRAQIAALTGHTGVVRSVAYSPDGQRIVTGSDDKTAKVWDAASGTELFPLKGHGSLITSVRFSPDGRRILTGSGDTTAKLWDAVNGKELLTLKGHDRDTFSVAFSPDGQRIATGSSDTTAKVWVAASIKQVADWQEEQRVVEQHLADLEQERVAEEASQSVLRVRDSIKQWLILAPIPWSRGQTNGQQALDIEQIPGEGQISPRAGEARFIDGSQIKWREVILTNEVIDFNAILGRMTEQSVAYAVCFIRSDAEQRGLRLLVGSDDDDKVYLNGKQVHRSVDGGFVVERDAVPDITLKAGLNVLVFKVVNETSFWLGSVRFTDDQGNPVKGIKITLDPKGGD